MIGTLNLTNRDYWLCYEFDLDEITLEQRIVVKMTDLDFWGRVQSGYYQAKFLKFDYKEYEEELLEQLNNTPLTKADYDLSLEKIKGSVKDLKRQHLQQYRNEESRLKHQFYKDCEEEFGFAGFPEEVKNFIHGKAYEEGHAYGFSEIANKYDDLVEFVNVCKEAFTNA